MRLRRADVPDARRSERGKRVVNRVTPGHGKFQPHAAFGAYIVKRRAQRTAIFDRCRRKKRWRIDSVRQHAPGRKCAESRDARIVRVQHSSRFVSIQSFDQLALCQRNFIHRRKKFQMRGSNARHHTNVRARNRREPRQLPAPRHAHLEHGRLMRFIQTKKRQRQPVLVVKISFRFQDPQLRAQQCRQDLFRCGLAHGACDAGNFPAPGFAHRAGQLLERFESVAHDDAAIPDGIAVAAGLRLRHQRGDGSATQRTRHVIVSIVTRSVDGNEQFSCTYRARINRDAGHPGHGVESRPRPNTQCASHLCNRPPHKCLKGFALRRYPVYRFVFTVFEGSSFRELTSGSRALATLSS